MPPSARSRRVAAYTYAIGILLGALIHECRSGPAWEPVPGRVVPGLCRGWANPALVLWSRPPRALVRARNRTPWRTAPSDGAGTCPVGHATELLGRSATFGVIFRGGQAPPPADSPVRRARGAADRSRPPPETHSSSERTSANRPAIAGSSASAAATAVSIAVRHRMPSAVAAQPDLARRRGPPRTAASAC